MESWLVGERVVYLGYRVGSLSILNPIPFHLGDARADQHVEQLGASAVRHGEVVGSRPGTSYTGATGGVPSLRPRARASPSPLPCRHPLSWVQHATPVPTYPLPPAPPVCEFRCASIDSCGRVRPESRRGGGHTHTHARRRRTRVRSRHWRCRCMTRCSAPSPPATPPPPPPPPPSRADGCGGTWGWMAR